MALEDLPDTVSHLVVAKLGLVDTIALSCTCRRLHRQAAGNGGPGQQQQQIALLAAAARQRLQVTVQGGWRDELLLTAWQQKQLMAAAEAVSKQRSTSISTRPNIVGRWDSNHDLLHCGLGLGFTEAARNQGPAQQQALVNFSGFLMPGPEVVDAARHFITDGVASAFIIGSSHISSRSPHACSSAPANAAEEALQISDTAEVRQPQPQQQQEQQSDFAWHVPSYEGSILAEKMQLLKGHLPPQTMYSAVGPYSRSGSGAAQHLTREAHNPVVDILTNSMREFQGVEQLKYLCGHYHRQDSNQRRQQLITKVNKLMGCGTAESDVGSSSAADKPVALLQLLVLPTPPPAGSIANLNHPWPPELHPGALCSGFARGLDGDPVLRMAVIGQEPAAVFRGAKHAYADVPVDVLPYRFQITLQHLDLSGTEWLHLCEEQLLRIVMGCRQLKSLSLAGTSASQYMFEALTHDIKAGSTTSSLFTAKPLRSGVCRSRSAASSTDNHLEAALRQQQRQYHAGAERAAAASKLADAGLKRCQAGRPTLPLKPMLAAVAAADAVAGLVVLDVSGCAALQCTDAENPVFAAFRQLLGGLSHLRVLLSCRTNVDAILQAKDPVHRPQPLTSVAAADITPSQPHTTYSSTSRQLKPSGSSVVPETQQSAAEAVLQAARLRAVLGSLAELDISYATCLSADCMAGLLTTCTQLKKLGVVGCKTLATAGGTEKLQAALLRLQRQQQQQQQASRSSALSSSALAPLEPLKDQLGSGMAALNLQIRQPEQFHNQAESQITQLQNQQNQQDDRPGQRLPRQQQETAQSVESGSCSSTSDDLCHKNALAQPVVAYLPQLTQLSVGWGWSAASIAALRSQSDCLTSFYAGVGACVTDSVLAMLADSCPHLQRLKLSLCPIISKGVGSVLASCPKLTSLQQQQCVGSVSMHELLQHKSQQQHSWQLSTLQLDGPSVDCSDAQLLQLIGISHQQHATETPSAPLRPAKCYQAITNLCLVRVIGLTDGLLHQLAVAGCQLQHLRLEECYSSSSSPTGHCAQQEQKCSALGTADTCSDSSVRSVPTTSFSQAALLRLLSQNCSLTLRSLQIRHAVAPLAVDFVELAVAAAPLLQRLVLDACDLLEKGLLVPETQAAGSHAALQALHVIRCQELLEDVTAGEEQHAHAHTIDPSNDHSALNKHKHRHQQGKLLNAEPTDISGQVQPGVSCHSCSQETDKRTPFRRRRDKELKVQLLQVGRSLHLPP